MDYFPIFLNLSDRKVLVVGAGEVACRKVDLLLSAKAKIIIVSPKLHPYLQKLVDNNQVTYLAKSYQKEDLSQVDLIWATTNNKQLNEQISKDAKQEKIWINVVDDPFYCDFITPSIVDRSPIQVAISSNGKSPVLIRYLREKLETHLPQNLSLLANFAGNKRDLIKTHLDTVDNRRKFWERFFIHPKVENANTEDELNAVFDLLLLQEENTDPSIIVVHIGNDPELLSLKALRLMQQTELILFDHSVSSIFIDLCRRDADRYFCQSIDEIIQRLNKSLSYSRICVISQNKEELEKIMDEFSIQAFVQFVKSIDA